MDDVITARILWLATPAWLKRALGLALAGVVAFGAGYWLGTRDAATRADLGAARDHIETRERIDNALRNPSGCAWADRLRGDCQ